MNRAQRIAIGTVQFGLDYGISNRRGKVPAAEAETILQRAAMAGITTVDTAAAYGDSEEVLAGLIARSTHFDVVTKTISVGNGVPKVSARASESANRFGKAAYGLLVHSAGDLQAPNGEALWRSVVALRDRGSFRKIGISAYASDDPVSLARRFRPDIMQVPVSVLDQRLVQSGALSELKSLGVEVHVRSSFVQGAIFLDPDKLPPAIGHARGRLKAFHETASAHNMTALQAAIGFPLSVAEIDRVVIGVTSSDELAEIIATAEEAPRDLQWRKFAETDDVLLDPRKWQIA